MKNGSKNNDIETHFFQTPAFQAMTIGVPFSIFKGLFGIMAARAGINGSQQVLYALGLLTISWALVDLLMNSARALSDISHRISPVEYCTLAQVGRYFHRVELFLAIDTFLSFSIICLALWSGWIVLLLPWESYLWYTATTLNLISISGVNIWLEYRRRSR